MFVPFRQPNAMQSLIRCSVSRGFSLHLVRNRAKLFVRLLACWELTSVDRESPVYFFRQAGRRQGRNIQRRRYDIAEQQLRLVPQDIDGFRDRIQVVHFLCSHGPDLRPDLHLTIQYSRPNVIVVFSFFNCSGCNLSVAMLSVAVFLDAWHCEPR